MSDLQPATSSRDTMTSLLGLFGLLAPELRDEIYRLTLVQEGPVRVTRAKNGPYIVKAARLSPAASPSRPETVRYHPTSCNVALLRTCGAINQEATPVLYGQNTWLWPVIHEEGHQALEIINRGATSIGSHLRTLLLGAWTGRQQVISVLTEMKRQVPQLTSLQKIIVSTGGLDEYIRVPAQLAERMASLMKEIKKQRQLDVAEVIAMIEVVPQNYRWVTMENGRRIEHGHVCDLDHDKAASVEFAELFKKALQLSLTGKLRKYIAVDRRDEKGRYMDPKTDRGFVHVFGDKRDYSEDQRELHPYLLKYSKKFTDQALRTWEEILEPDYISLF